MLALRGAVREVRLREVREVRREVAARGRRACPSFAVSRLFFFGFVLLFLAVYDDAAAAAPSPPPAAAAAAAAV